MPSDTAHVAGMVPGGRDGPDALFGLHRRIRMGLRGEQQAAADADGGERAPSEGVQGRAGAGDRSAEQEAVHAVGAAPLEAGEDRAREQGYAGRDGGGCAHIARGRGQAAGAVQVKSVQSDGQRHDLPESLPQGHTAGGLQDEEVRQVPARHQHRHRVPQRGLEHAAEDCLVGYQSIAQVLA